MKPTSAGSLLLITVLWLVAGCFQAALAKACDETVARMLSIQGQVERFTEEKHWTPIELNEPLCPGDRIHVGAGSRASLLLENETLLRLAENSSVTIGAQNKGGGTWIDLLEGIAHFISRVRHGFQVNTPYVNAGVEGTEFTVEAASDYAAVTVLEGRVRAHNAWGEVLLQGGQKAVAYRGEAPHIEQVVDPLDAVRWTLYYPPVFDKLLAHASVAGQRSFEAYRRGDIETAFSALDQERGIEQDASLLVYRAALHLRVGGVKEARRDLANALRLKPEWADALSLLSIIATVQNQRQEALELAQRAVAAAPTELSPLLALSYARQASFQLPAALDAAKQATKTAPESALAWSQLARLHVMFHEVDEADAAARQAVAIAPEQPYSLVTLGFIQLIRMEFDSARQTFVHAINLNGAAAPLPRLGLGLLEIRQGHLAEGRRQLEIAANLDPGNAMIRSYLGKAYYDEKREKLAATQFALAKQLDELDPTAWFYNAVLKLWKNRPNEALDELQTAIDLNDNRAVYRSRYLLDQDEAARIDTLGRIYADIGFLDQARVEAYKSLQVSASNYSAHRLLAETVDSSKASNSELLQSQLLQPLNRYSLKPQILSQDFSIIDGAGPPVSGFSEYAPLFTGRNGIGLQIDGAGGSYHSKGDDLILSGLHDKVAFGLMQSRYRTDGWRENSDGEQDYRDAFLQVALTSSTSLQFEYIQKDSEQGDRVLRFEPDDFYDSDRFGMKRKARRIGFHHQFASNGHFILSFITQDLQKSTLNIRETVVPKEFTGGDYPGLVVENRLLLDDNDSRTYEFQFIQPFQDHTFIFGAANHNETLSITSAATRTRSLILPFPPFTYPVDSLSRPPITHDFDPEYKNIYLYGQFSLSDRVNLTLGANHEEVEGWGPLHTDSRTNPKYGLTWEVWKGTFLRAAYIESLSSPSTMKTIEPTQIAGFNQLIDKDYGGAEIREFGLGIDTRVSRTLTLGAQYSRIDDQTPWYSLNSSGLKSVNYTGNDDETYETYLHWMASKRLSFYLDYFERKQVQTGQGESQLAILQETHTGIDYHWPSGVYLHTSGAYLDQKINSTGEEKWTNFWYLIGTVGYRLPKRYGRVEISVENLLDKEFKLYGSTGPYLPERQVSAAFTINF